MLFKWVKLGFEFVDTTLKKEAKMLAANIMKSMCRAYEGASVKVDNSDTD